MKRIDKQNIFEFTSLKPENETKQSKELLRQITEQICEHLSVSEITDALSVTAKTNKVKFKANGRVMSLGINNQKRLMPGNRLIVDSESFSVISV